MTNLQRQVQGPTNGCQRGQVSRRNLLRQVLLIGGSVPIASALLPGIGISPDTAAISGTPPESADDPIVKLLRCSFCNRDQNDVRKLIAGPRVFICDECVQVCRDIIVVDERFAARSAR